jgi:hypothetical protein
MGNEGVEAVRAYALKAYSAASGPFLFEAFGTMFLREAGLHKRMLSEHSQAYGRLGSITGRDPVPDVDFPIVHTKTRQHKVGARFQSADNSAIWFSSARPRVDSLEFFLEAEAASYRSHRSVEGTPLLADPVFPETDEEKVLVWYSKIMPPAPFLNQSAGISKLDEALKIADASGAEWCWTPFKDTHMFVVVAVGQRVPVNAFKDYAHQIGKIDGLLQYTNKDSEPSS